MLVAHPPSFSAVDPHFLFLPLDRFVLTFSMECRDTIATICNLCFFLKLDVYFHQGRDVASSASAVSLIQDLRERVRLEWVWVKLKGISPWKPLRSSEIRYQPFPSDQIQ